LKLLLSNFGGAIDFLKQGLLDSKKAEAISFNYSRSLTFNKSTEEIAATCDVFVLQGTWGSKHLSRQYNKNVEKNKTMATLNESNQQMYNLSVKLKKPLIVFETYTLTRQRRNHINIDYKNMFPRYYRMGLGHWIYGKGQWCYNQLPNRLLRMNKEHQLYHNFKLNFFDHSWNNNPNGYILVLPGLEHDPTNEDVESWLAITLQHIRSVTDRKIVIKPHPLSTLNFSSLLIQSSNTYLIDSNLSLQETSKDVFAAVIDNSTSVFELVDLGIPCFCSQDNFGVDLKNTDLNNIENPYYPNPKEYSSWANKMSYTEFSAADISNEEIIIPYIKELIEKY